MTTGPNIEAFFREPNVPPAGREFSTLYLLRRDIIKCLGRNPDDGSEIGYKVIWPGAMATLAGIDLLGKFLAGEDGPGVGERFRAFVQRYFGLSTGDDEVLYQLRNGLLHSFGLYSKPRSDVYRFVVTDKGGAPNLVTRSANIGQYIVDLRILHHKFEDSIRKYRSELETYTCLRANFENMYPFYGQVTIDTLEQLVPGSFEEVDTSSQPATGARKPQSLPEE